MKEYYKSDNGTLYHGDCLKIMPEFKQKFDMILTDPPYGTTACKWDSIIPLDPMWRQLKGLIKSNGAIVMTASQPFTTTLISSNIKMFKYCWVWKKSKGSNFPHAPNMPLKITEDVVVFSNSKIGHKSQLKEKRMTYNPQGTIKGKTIVRQNPNKSELKYHRDSHTNHKQGYRCKAENYPTTLLDIKSEGKTVHPTQKPIALMEYLIKTYTNENETILDFASGSGTTGIACERLNRKWIMIEKEEEYCEIAVKRIKREISQLKLW